MWVGPSLALTRWAMRAGDLKTIHWSTAMVSWPSSFWIVMSPPKNSNENGDTSVQSYRKIWGHREMSLTHNDRSIITNTLTHSVAGSGIIMTQCTRQLFCGVGWKCPISEERLCEFEMCFRASSVRKNVILPCLWISQMCYTFFRPLSSLC